MNGTRENLENKTLVLFGCYNKLRESVVSIKWWKEEILLEKKRFKFVIPIMVIVALSAVFMINEYYAEVPNVNRLFIIIGATLLSGVLAYFLFPQEGENKVDDRWPE